MTVERYWEPKAGSSPAEYEDAIAWSARLGRFGVADGASASAFARLWAELLVRAYVAGNLNAATIEADLAPLQHCWAESVEARQLPWYALEQVRRGAFAALAGLTLEEHGEWQAVAVGDCCVFQVRGDDIIAALPLTDPDAFDNRPLLLGSRPAANGQLRAQNAIVVHRGEWQPGDLFLMMSDALAAAYLRHRCLAFHPTPRSFRRWIKGMREQHLLRNDDVSLLRLALPADAAA